MYRTFITGDQLTTRYTEDGRLISTGFITHDGWTWDEETDQLIKLQGTAFVINWLVGKFIKFSHMIMVG